MVTARTSGTKTTRVTKVSHASPATKRVASNSKTKTKKIVNTTGVKASKAGTGYVLRSKTRRAVITPHHKEWWKHGPGEVTIKDIRRHRKKKSWLKPWHWGSRLVNRKTTLTSPRKKQTKNIVAEEIYKNRQKQARAELQIMDLHRLFGQNVNAGRRWKLRMETRSPYSARINSK